LFLRVDDLDDHALQAHLVDAARRGVDVHVVLTPKGELSPSSTLNVLRLTDDGLDVAVKKTSTLEVGTAITDGDGWLPGKPDPVVGPGAPVKTPVTKLLTAFHADLSTVRHGAAKTGLLKPETVQLYEQPASTAQPILNALKSAKTSIDLEIYQIGDPDVTAALIAAAKRGVKVRVMLEPKTVGSSNFAAVSKVLTAAGIELKPTPPQFDSSHNVDHAKFMLIDQKELLLGSGNLVRYGLGGNELESANSRDFWVGDTRAQSLTEAHTLFEADWARTPTSAASFVNLVVTPDNVRSRVYQVIDSAKTTLSVYNQSLDDPQLLQKLIDAKKRGVEVKVLLGDQPIPHLGPKNAPAVKALRAAGIPTEYLTRSYLHAKAIITESQAFIGSQNFTGGGLGNNREVGTVLDDAAVLKAASAQFAADFAAPGPQP
jgi:phosphatidylserine/phosphatidylglycerophosphate/cardiolipin synthase-like enzyme